MATRDRDDMFDDDALLAAEDDTRNDVPPVAQVVVSFAPSSSRSVPQHQSLSSVAKDQTALGGFPRETGGAGAGAVGHQRRNPVWVTVGRGLLLICVATMVAIVIGLVVEVIRPSSQARREVFSVSHASVGAVPESVPHTSLGGPRLRFGVSTSAVGADRGGARLVAATDAHTRITGGKSLSLSENLRAGRSTSTGSIGSASGTEATAHSGPHDAAARRRAGRGTPGP
eukprot:TRINITY_DN5748_c0_g1_i1.p2 TRINITY_DN5748_c0_g1~~TRINITY_DN5748_c0_g1_i1.p2  ORF type:complete len:228 (+),score=31.15 TRINITY_DN5748_c0_g1_i1:153-836(+)